MSDETDIRIAFVCGVAVGTLVAMFLFAMIAP